MAPRIGRGTDKARDPPGAVAPLGAASRQTVPMQTSPESADAALWPAPRAEGPIKTTVPMPGSKSVTNRALVLAALAGGPSVLRAPLRSRDTLLMAGALRAIGVAVVDGADHAWQVTPAPLRGPAEVECGLAGTVMRFVPPVAVLASGQVHFDGDPYARTRPMGRLVRALRSLGATMTAGGPGPPPSTAPGTAPLPGAP